MTIQEQFANLKRGSVEILPEQDLLTKLKAKKHLRVKLGIDPTAFDVHLGFTVVMRKLREFQDLGHQVILIVGDYTAIVGDPSGRNKTRPLLTHDAVLEYAKSYQEQFFKIVDKEKTEIVYNGDWFKQMSFNDVTKLMSKMTVAQMLEREDFQNRYRKGQPISLHEFMYPMMQGYDSVQIEADVELGGTDQRFNVIRGRDLQKSAGQEPQVGFLMPILIGTDGKEKMSKSLGNTIGINESHSVMFHKLINIPDHIVEDYCILLTNWSEESVHQKIERMKNGTIHPKDVKEALAKDIVSQYHGHKKANEASEEEKKVHLGEVLPQDMPLFELEKGSHWIVSLMVACKLVSSNGEARRMIQNGGVSFDKEKIIDYKANLKILDKEHILRMGKRKFVKIVGI